MTTPRIQALSPADFAGCMAPLDPFEASPHVAVACSGGADSLALALLADAWARSHGGRITALVVDHGLRADSREEAVRVAAWLAARDVAAVASGFRSSARRAPCGPSTRGVRAP